MAGSVNSISDSVRGACQMKITRVRMEYFNWTIQPDQHSGERQCSRETNKKHLGELDHVGRLSEVPVLVFALQGISGEEIRHSVCTGCRFPDIKGKLQYEVEAGAATVKEITVLCFMTYRLCCVFVLLITKKEHGALNIFSSFQAVVQLLLCPCAP